MLVIPGGTEIGLEIFRSLAHCKEVSLYSAGSPISNHAPHVFKRHYDLPSVFEKHWLQFLNDLINDQQIDLIYAAHDDVLTALIDNSSDLRAPLIASPVETIRVCRSKSDTYRLLGKQVAVPDIHGNSADVDVYPVFVKPDRGQGSQGAQRASDRKELEYLCAQLIDFLIMEYLPGPEFTVDCFSDRERGLLHARGRERVRTRYGIAHHSRFINNPEFYATAQVISEALSFHGAWFFQLREDVRGKLKLLEVGPRIAGMMGRPPAPEVVLPANPEGPD